MSPVSRTQNPDTFGECLDATLVEVTVAVENDLLDLLAVAGLCKGLAYNTGDADLPVIDQILATLGAGEGQRATRIIIDDLGVDLLVTSEDRQPGALGGPEDRPLSFMAMIVPYFFPPALPAFSRMCSPV